MDEQSTMHERLGFGHALIFCAVILLLFILFLSAWVVLGLGLQWMFTTASEAIQGALSGLGVAL